MSLSGPQLAHAENLRRIICRSRELWGCPAESCMGEISDAMDNLSRHLMTISDCLLVVVAGGTKVGKTTLINALAGMKVGETSARACLTSRPAIYVHKKREHFARTRLEKVLIPGDRFEIHESPALERLILVDTPDLDGVDAAHHDVFHSLLEHADLALCVVTTQKYDSMTLYTTLGDRMGFRRTVFVFNRVDEGIPLTKKICDDLASKIFKLGLKPPDGNEIPIFSISALNAFLKKTGKPAGPVGKFSEFEAFLNERLDEELTRQINEENCSERIRETYMAVSRACMISEAMTFCSEITPLLHEIISGAVSDVSRTIEKSIDEFAGEMARCRAAAAAKGLGGPFGIYVRLSLALSGLIDHANLLVTFQSNDITETIAKGITAAVFPIISDSLDIMHKKVIERGDRIGINGEAVAKNLAIDSEFKFEELHGKVILGVKPVIAAPEAGMIENFLLNLAPLVIILLVIRYFVTALLSAGNPSAGIFIGAGTVLLICCHLQSVFWIRRKSTSVEPIKQVVNEIVRNEFDRRALFPLNNWAETVNEFAGNASRLPEKAAISSDKINPAKLN